MQSFNLQLPTKVIFGKNAQDSTVSEIKKLNAKKVFIVYGSNRIKENVLLENIENMLKKENIDYTFFNNVKANPLLSHTRVGVKKAIEFNADLILGIGGGSVIDTAKAIAIGAANPHVDIWDFWTYKKTLEKTINVGCIVTISAAGSETSTSAVLTNDETLEKRGLNTEFNRPKFAIMNPCFTFTLPYYQVACGIVDIMMHTLDRYFADNFFNETTDAIAEALLRVVIKNGLIAMKDKNNYDAMSELMWCGSLSHNTLTGLGNEFDFIAHKFGHELSAQFDVAHGASLATVWGHWAKYCYDYSDYTRERFRKYAKNVWNVDDALEGINKTIEYFKQINMPTNFTELGIGIQDDDMLNLLTNRTTKNGSLTFNHFRALNKDDVFNIFRSCNV